MKTSLPFNKVCNLKDFRNGRLLEIMRAIYSHDQRSYAPDFPHGSEKLSYWESAMSIYTLQEHGLLHQQSTILVLGFGLDPLVFYLTNKVKQVFVADLFLSEENWNKLYPRLMLLAPEEFAPYPCRIERLVIQHLDQENPRFPFQSFDAIVAGNIVEKTQDMPSLSEFLGNLAQSLKTQGILTLNAKYQILAPPGVRFCSGIHIPKIKDLQESIESITNTALIQDIETEVSEETLGFNRNVTIYAEVHQGRYFSSKLTVNNYYDWSNEPGLVHIHDGIAFSSVHIALKKLAIPTELEQIFSYVDNAPPSAAVQAMLVSRPHTLDPSPPVSVTRLDNTPMVPDQERIYNLQQLYYAWEAIRLKGWYNKHLHRLPRPVSGMLRFGMRLAMLGRAYTAQAELSQALIDYCRDVETRLGQLHNAHAQQSSQLMNSIAHQQNALTELQQQLKGFFEQNERIREEHANRLLHFQASIETWQQQTIFLQETLAHIQQQVQQHDQQIRAYDGQWQNMQTLISRSQQQLSDLEHHLRHNTGQLRYLRYQQAMHSSSTEKSASVNLGDDLIRVITHLEVAGTGLEKCQAIEVSVQDANAEQPLMVISTYFGKRLSSHGETYKYPNDAWIHIDLVDTQVEANLVMNASSRLGNQGLFILITTGNRAEELDDSRFRLRYNETIMLADKRSLQAFVWEFVNKDGHVS